MPGGTGSPRGQIGANAGMAVQSGTRSEDALALTWCSTVPARSGHGFDVDHDQTCVGHPYPERGHAATVGQPRSDAQVEFPTVQRADHRRAADEAVGKRPTAMRAAARVACTAPLRR